MMAVAGPAEGAGATARHIPVLLSQVLAALAPKPGERYIDGTFGAGGYARAILDAADCRLLAIDRDPDAVAAGAALVAHYASRLTLVQGRFGDLADIARQTGFAPIDGVVLDLGVSSMQLDTAERGFSFMADGPLDMRMSGQGPSAADVVNRLSEADLAEVLWVYGEEKRSRAIARAICADRQLRPFTRTGELAGLIERVIGRGREPGRHPATRSFQALRIFVNRELEELAAALLAAEQVLAPEGRLAVVTFHSLEDRIVKQFLKERTGRTARSSRHLPGGRDESAETFRFVNQRPVSPEMEETEANPRARSAKLRWAVRTAAPVTESGIAGLPRIRASLSAL